MDHQFKRLLNLVRRTGDRLVVTDSNGEDTYVLMGLEAYEHLAEPSSHLPRGRQGGGFDNDFLDDYYNNDEDDDEYDDKINNYDPDCKIPDEFYTGNVGANGNSPSIYPLPEPHVSPESQESLKSHIPESPAPEFQKINKPSDIWSVMPPAGEKTETWNTEKFGETEKKIIEDRFGNNSQTITEVVKSESAESVQKSDENEDLGEEQYYLEPVE